MRRSFFPLIRALMIRRTTMPSIRALSVNTTVSGTPTERETERENSSLAVRAPFVRKFDAAAGKDLRSEREVKPAQITVACALRGIPFEFHGNI